MHDTYIRIGVKGSFRYFEYFHDGLRTLWKRLNKCYTKVHNMLMDNHIVRF